MEEIKWIHSVDCRSCAFEMKNAPRKKMERIIDDRRRLPKCGKCERLIKAIKETIRYEDIR